MSITTLLSRDQNTEDQEWIKFATRNSRNVKIFSWDSLHNLVFTKCFKGSNTNIQFLKNDLVSSKLNDGLVKRDYFIVKEATSLYFTSLDNSSNDKIIELFAKKCISSKKYPELGPIYLFSESNQTWYQLNLKNFKWISIFRPPTPQGNYIGFSSSSMSHTTRVEISLL